MIRHKLTIEEILELSEGDITYELKEGAAHPKISPKRFHSRLTGALYQLLSDWNKERGEVGIEWAIILKRNGQDWVPVPDLLYISYEKLPEDRFEDEACPIPPELVIEIISPGQLFGDLSEKATDYLKAGVSRVWIIDSPGKTITIFYPSAPPLTKRVGDTLSDEMLPELELKVDKVFDKAGIL